MMQKWVRAKYQPNRPLEDGRYVTACEEHIALSSKAAGEGMVLLKNEGGALPLSKETLVAGFGKGLHDIVKGGGGSGDVYTPFITSVAQGIEKAGGRLDEELSDYYLADIKRQYEGGAAPGMTIEPEVPENLLLKAAEKTDTALIVLSRFSGEGWDRQGGVWDDPEVNQWKEAAELPRTAQRLFPDGDFYLTGAERALAEAVKKNFRKTIVVLNTGGVMETAWIRDDSDIDAALLMWQGGMDGGYAAARILYGDENPSGHLPDTFAERLEDYPSTEHFHDSPWYVDYTEDIYVGYRYFETIPGEAGKVVYPFGYGLSYTSFDQKVVEFEEDDECIRFSVEVTNTGSRPGKDVAAVYYQAPQGALGKPSRELGAFAKTGLLEPGHTQTLNLTILKKQMASFDDLGKICSCAFVLEAGDYHFYLGSNVREAALLEQKITLEKDIIVEQLSDALHPHLLEKRLLADGSYEALPVDENPDINECVLEKMQPGIDEGVYPERTARPRYYGKYEIPEGVRPLIDVAEGRISMREFAEQLSDDELIHLLGGVPNKGVANTFGFGNLDQYGFPSVMTADGPAGVRIKPECGIATTAFPCETLLASTWNTQLIEEVGAAAAQELKENNLQIWLAPAMNIHRNPVCGRNFEYLSEDPYLTGKMAAAEVKGIQSQGVSACIKHFACNNKETNRKHCDSRVSMRALREIYLRAFEMVIKEADPWSLMSSYNPINAQRASESRDLLTQILRQEWGFTGAVTTDWWNRGEQYKEILAGNDVEKIEDLLGNEHHTLWQACQTHSHLLKQFYTSNCCPF